MEIKLLQLVNIIFLASAKHDIQCHSELLKTVQNLTTMVVVHIQTI